MEVRINQGKYDFAHPNEIQDHARIVLPVLDKPLNLCCKENSIDYLRGEDWSYAVPEILKEYIKGTLWSSCLDLAQKALEWAESDEGQETLQKEWAENELKYVESNLERLEKRKEKLKAILR